MHLGFGLRLGATGAGDAAPVLTVPAKMDPPSLTVVSASQIDVALAAAPDNGGSAILSYDLRYSEDESDWTTVTGISDPEEITGLTAETLYYVQTRAVNAIGAGDWSDSASETTNALVPYVTSVTATPTGGSTAQLDIVAGPVGADVFWGVWTGGNVPADPADVEAGTGAEDSGTFEVTGAPVAFSGPSGLDPNTTYEAGVVSKLGSEYSAIETDTFTTEAVDTTAPVLSLRTNLLEYSEQFDNAAWVKTRSTVTANVATAPDGSATADKLVESAETGTHYATQSLTAAVGTGVFSLYAKAAERDHIRMQFGGGGQSPQEEAIFNLTTGAVVSFTGSAAGIEAIGDGWYRCWSAGNWEATSAAPFVALHKGGTSYAGDGTSGVYLWGAQLEVSGPVSDYIPTTASATSADVTVLSETSAELAWETTEQRGISHVVVSTDSTTPNVGQVAAGLDGTGSAAVWAAGGGSGQAVSPTTTQTATATGLTEVLHYAWALQYDPSLNASNVLALGSFTPADVTAPVLSSFDLALDTDPGFDGSLNTDTAEGTLDVVLADPDNAPSKAQVKAGQDHTGATAAGRIEAQAVSASGPQAIAGTATANGTWRAYAVHTDAAGNESEVLASDATIVIAAVEWLPSDETLLAWIDASDTTTTFQDNAASTAAGVTDPVMRINDRVNGLYYRTATTGARPILTAGGLDFDGSDDHLRSDSALNLSSYNQITVFAVVEGDTDGASQMIAELGGSAGTGRFFVMRDANKYAIASRGSAAPNSNQRADSSTSYAAPDLSVIVATLDIPGDANTLYVNGSQDGQATGDQGSGNFASTDLLNIGSRNEGTSMFFNGRIAEIGIIAGVADSTLRANIVSYTSSKWGVS